MTYRHILAPMNETAASLALAHAAADLARRNGAVLTGVFLQSEFLNDMMATEALAYMAPNDIDSLLQQHARSLSEANEAARAQFEAAAADAGVKSVWMTLRGEDDRALIACARRSDLLVLPRQVKVSLARWSYGAGSLAMAAGGPVLLCPDDGCPPGFGSRILVAWNGSREAARALRDAWPLLSAARQVDVVIVDPRGEAGADGLLQRHFEHHGCKANILVDRGRDDEAVEVLRRHALELGSDLMVMGGYGHSRVREFILGGVTASVLDAPVLPTLLSH